MKKKFTSILTVFIILCVLYWIYSSSMPQTISKNENLSDFSTQRALKIVKEISKKPHYIGSENHTIVVDYLISELKKLGLHPEIQSGYSLPDLGNLGLAKNIITKINGSDPNFSSNKALLLLAHYDSAPHSFSDGASDDGSGVATILEGVRAFLHNNTYHKNDIIILFTDAEELGLNGAALFVKQHKWAKNIGLAINFEARGTGGPSYMLMEVNQGNAKMVKNFYDSDIRYPVSNSLMYSIYKMLPNDTDLTIFRENGKIQGFNFAFIDNHFDYHTVQDDYQHLDPLSLQHQGSYLTPLLNHFSNSNLNQTESNENYVYFNTPFNFIIYPFAWVLPLSLLALLIFLILIFCGFAKKNLSSSDIIKGFGSLFFSIFFVGLVAYIGWKIILLIYPQYDDILQGFTYNGHDYILAFLFLSLSICFLVYKKFSTNKKTISYFIAPLFLWIIINLIIAIKLKGAGFLIIPAFCGLIILGYYIINEKTNYLLNIILSIPILIILAPFVSMFPVGLGLKIIFGSCVLVVLIFVLLLPILNSFSHKIGWSFLMLFFSSFFFFKANLYSDYRFGMAKPNSLLYILDSNNNSAIWATYDKNLDLWTQTYLGINPRIADDLNQVEIISKYNSKFTYIAKAPLINLPKPLIEFEIDSIADNRRFLRIKITSNRKVNRYDIFAKNDLEIGDFRANNCKPLNQKGILLHRNGSKILSYYVVDSTPLLLEFSINASKNLEMDLLESSFDLTENPLFKINSRLSWMIPAPFILNDAVVIKQKIIPSDFVDETVQTK